jgi:hypothetical protein
MKVWNSPSQLMDFTWYPRLLEARRITSRARYSSSATQLVRGTRLRNCIMQSMPVIIGIPFTNIISMQNTKFWCFSRSSGGISTRSSFTGLRLLLVLFPFSAPISAPNIFSAISTSSVVTGQLLMIFCCKICLKFATVGHPTI